MYQQVPTGMLHLPMRAIVGGAAGFTFTVSTQTNQVVDPCAIAGNQAVFHPNFCGMTFGGTTLAVAATSYFGSGLVSQSDITFNSGKTWGVYSGNGAGWDFRRVAVHEMGHVLGLNHSNVSAIMLPTIGTIEVPQADDMAGVTAIYGPIPGDEDGNGVVTTSDVIAILNIVLGATVPQGNGENCDGLGSVMVTDVICAINTIISN